MRCLPAASHATVGTPRQGPSALGPAACRPLRGRSRLNLGGPADRREKSPAGDDKSRGGRPSGGLSNSSSSAAPLAGARHPSFGRRGTSLGGTRAFTPIRPRSRRGNEGACPEFPAPTPQAPAARRCRCRDGPRARRALRDRRPMPGAALQALARLPGAWRALPRPLPRHVPGPRRRARRLAAPPRG